MYPPTKFRISNYRNLIKYSRTEIRVEFFFMVLVLCFTLYRNNIKSKLKMLPCT